MSREDLIMTDISHLKWKPFTRISDHGAGRSCWMSRCPVLQVLVWKADRWLDYCLPSILRAGLCLSGETAEGLQNVHRSGQLRKTPRFKQEILFQHQAITTPHSLHCADLPTEHCERRGSTLFSWSRHNKKKLMEHLKCGCDNIRLESIIFSSTFSHLFWW